MTTDTPRTDASKPKLTRESYDENWNMITDTLRTDACPYCGSIENDIEGNRTFYVCGTYHTKGCHPARSSLCCEIEERNEWKERAEKAEAELSALQRLRPTRDDVKKLEAEVERLRSALELIAAPKRPDGTYNRCREACETLASKALNPSDK